MDSQLLAAVVDAIIVLTLAELIILRWLGWRPAVGARMQGMTLNIASGLCLMLALRFALTEASAWLVLMWIMASGFLHGADLWQRWRR